MESAMAGRNGAKVQGVTASRPPGRVLAAKWDDRDVFTIEEAGEILLISRGSAYLAAKTGDLPVISVGRRRIVPRLALERLLGATAA
jgi:Helix-turn-helix domain